MLNGPKGTIQIGILFRRRLNHKIILGTARIFEVHYVFRQFLILINSFELDLIRVQLMLKASKTKDQVYLQNADINFVDMRSKPANFSVWLK